MKFSTNEDVEVPIEATFDLLCDFESMERAAMRRGAEVQRVDTQREIGRGMIWNAVFSWRGKKRALQIELVTYNRANALLFHSKTDGLSGSLSFDLMPLSRTRTRMKVGLEVIPQSLSAKLLVQSLRLAKASLTKRYKLRVSDYIATMEERHNRMQGDRFSGPF